MGRPYSHGVRYFPFEVDFSDDPKIRELRADFGDKGELAFVRLLSVIYKNEGYFTAWTDRELKSFAGKYGYSAGFVRELTLGCVKCDLFDEGVFNAFRALTSRGIQCRYLEIVQNRGKIYLEESLLLVDLDDTEFVPAGVRGKICLKNSFRKEKPHFLKENPRFLEENPIKEKKSKEKISSYEDIGAGKPASPRAQKKSGFVPPGVDEVRAYCRERQNGIDPEQFVDHYNANGWKVGGRAPMKDWKAAVRTWERNGFSGGKTKTGQAPPSYDLDAVMKAAEELDPTKTKRGDV